MQSFLQNTATHLRNARAGVSHGAMLAGARLKRLQGRELAVGLGGLLAGVVMSAALMQPQIPDRPKAEAPQAPAAPQQVSEKSDDVSAPIKIVGPSAEGRIPCADQTWPYIERRCLTEAPPRVVEQAPPQPAVIAAPAAPAAAAAAAAAAEPIHVATPVATPVETTGVAAVREAEITPAISETKAAPEPIETKKISKREQRRAERQARREAEARKREAEANKREELARKEEADKDERIKRVSAERPARERARAPVKRWRELVYDYPDGSRRRVILQGSRSAEAALSDED